MGEPVSESLEAPVLLKLGDKISTDAISPAGSQVLILRTNVPALAEFCFRDVDLEFAARAKAAGRSVLVAGEHYGQGSAREVAALGPMYLGVRAVIAKSFARIHRANLVNWGVAPLVFDDPAAYDGIVQNDRLRLGNLRAALAAGKPVQIENLRSGAVFTASSPLSARERELLLAGGLLAHTCAGGSR
jgi:aconitate hydratase